MEALLNGLRLYYEHYDLTPHWLPPRDPVLFIHGLGVDHTIWRHQIAPFATRRPMIVVDTRGHGRSEKRAGDPYTIASHAEDMVALLDEVGCARAHLVGTSMGGTVAQQIAIHYPDRVATLTLVATFCEPPEAVDLDARLKLFDEAPDLDTLYRPIVGRALGRNAPPEVADLILALEVNNPRDALRSGNVSTFTYRACEAAAGIRVPTLVLVGEEDGSTPPTSSEMLVATIPGARLATIPGAGHTPYLETPTEFNRIVLEFLEAEDPTS